jgi:hypothetical protein
MTKVKQAKKTNQTEMISVEDRQRACSKEIGEALNKYGMYLGHKTIPVILPIPNEK